MEELNFCNLKDVLTCPYEIWAHINQDKPAESLEEHTLLCESYFRKIEGARKISSFFEKIADLFSLSEECKVLYHEMISNVITFHDTGKINPRFQKEKMGNSDKALEGFAIKGVSDTSHSMLSAIIYLNHYMNQIKRESQLLKGFCLINGFVISRHHSHLGNMRAFIHNLQENGSGAAIIDGLEKDSSWLKDPLYGKSHAYDRMWGNFIKGMTQKEGIAIYAYTRFLYSILVFCDYYATTEYQSGVCTEHFGSSDKQVLLGKIYEETPLVKTIRQYEKMSEEQRSDLSQNINILRTEIFLEAERSLKKNIDQNIFFLEAPTGSGKSNTAINLSFQLLKKGYRNLYYVYPFNTLVDQNISVLENIFGKDNDLFHQITVLNSSTPIKGYGKEVEEIEDGYYEKILLDKQFLNYPFVLTTHVSLFRTMFGDDREAVFGFSQLKDSVIVLDEIQSYKNTIWSEIITFLKTFAKFLNIKIIIMSATLPNLGVLVGESVAIPQLLENKYHYYANSLFRNRVQISYELLDKKINLEMLKRHLIQKLNGKNKIVIEFLKKKRAYEFFDLLANDPTIQTPLYMISGDDNRADRIKKLNEIKQADEHGAILVSTQVIEAGVDIDMDIGYKDISKFDSEEQFLGRINRGCKRSGIVYFFNLDDAKKVYKDGDIRINKELTLLEPMMRDMLIEKDFENYYMRVMQILQSNLNQSLNERMNLEDFFKNKVKELNFPDISSRMRLIEEDDWSMSIFLSRKIEIKGEIICGEEVWSTYKLLLQDQEMPYAEKQVKLSGVKSKLDYFVYEIGKNPDLTYHDQIGEIYYIDNGEDYFLDGRLNKEKLENGNELFL